MLGRILTRPERPRAAVGVALGALALGALVFATVREPNPPPLPADAAPAGTPLPDGFVVAEGSARLGPLVARQVDATGTPVDWFAVIAVLDEPLAVWNDYVRQIGRLLGEPAKRPGVGCSTHAFDGFRCALTAVGAEANGRRLFSGVAMDSVPGDVTGRYMIHLQVMPTVLPYDGFAHSAEPHRKAQPPERARPRPDVGEPLAPETVAYKNDDRKYVLLEGSELVTQWSQGSGTGGFEVVLRVLRNADIDRVAEAYAAQAAQFSGVTERRTIVSKGVSVTTYRPPGGAGGYAATIWAVDQPGRDADYIYYSLLND